MNTGGIQFTHYARQWPNRNEPEVAENPDTICPLTSLVTRFRFYGTGTTQRPLFFTGVTVYVMNSDLLVPAFCFQKRSPYAFAEDLL